MTLEAARDTLLNAYDQKYRPEMHDVERRLVLDQYDNAWKSHLLTMDSLKSGAPPRGLRPGRLQDRVRREGMKEFDKMWESIRDRITEAVFRVEEMGDEEAQGRPVGRGQRIARCGDLGSSGEAGDVEAASEMQTNAGGEVKKVEPIRNLGAKVEGNDSVPLWVAGRSTRTAT
ncbi:MAG: hypothetical protein U0792_13660 [Gemmataceae bacterium]